MMIYSEEIIRKEKFELCGIYKIHLNDDFYYVGSAIDMRRRWMKHISMLKLGKHHNAIIRSTYEEKHFDELLFSVLEICEKSEIEHREERILRVAMIDPLCINITNLHHGGDTNSKHPNREKINESRRKPKIKSKILVSDVLYDSAADASRKLNLPTTTIAYRVKSKKFQDYSYHTEG